MKNQISFKRASLLGVLLFSMLTLFHLFVILGILIFDYAPLAILWGGEMNSIKQLLHFEIFSMFTSLLGMLIILIRGNKTYPPKLMHFTRIFLWIFFALFVLNTIGNIIAHSIFEKLFSVMTVLLSVICYRLAVEPMHSKEK